MRFELRKRKILELLLEKEELTVGEAASQFNVSEITIRRDFANLDRENLVLRTPGGVVSLPRQPVVSFRLKDQVHQEAKQIIAEKAAALVKDGDVLFVDCGSTTYQLCRFIRTKKVKVITNSLPVLQALSGSKCEVNLIGGTYDSERQALHGKMAEWHIQQYHATKAFIGADAIDENHQLWANSEKEAEISGAMIQHADQTYVLADRSKFGKRGYLRFGDAEKELIFISEM